MSSDTASAKPTLEDVARAAGLSRATVSRAVRGGERVSPAAREAIDTAIRKLDYVPNRAARQLAQGRTETIAVVLPEPDTRIFADPFFALTVAGVNDALADSPVQPVLLMGDTGTGVDRILPYLHGGHADGVLVVSHHLHDRLAEELGRLEMPAVFVGRPLGSEERLHYVDVDNYDGGRQAALHLIDRGCTRLASIDGPADMAAALDRAAGWNDALREAGIRPLAAVPGDFTARAGRQAMARLLADHPDVEGVFAASDLMAVSALNWLQRTGIDVPGRLRVVGFDNHAFAADAVPPLTTIKNPAREMARRATDMLMALVDGRTTRRRLVLPCTLVERASTAPA